MGWRLVRLVGVWWIEGRYLDIDKLAERDREGYIWDSHRQINRQIDK